MKKSQSNQTQPVQWSGFQGRTWREEISVRDFIQHNYIPYSDDESFLAPVTPKTAALWEKVSLLMKEEEKAGILDADTAVASTILSHDAGYIDRDLEVIFGLQTDAPFKRALMLRGGWRMVDQALHAYGRELDGDLRSIYKGGAAKTHNDAVFGIYTEAMLRARKSGVITGLPDGYGRGRIIGDYRRVALYGLDLLVKAKAEEKREEEVDLDLRDELHEQLLALEELRKLGTLYGFDLSRPAANAREAVQWTYLAYLASTKEQDGAAMSLGRISTFLDIYIERDLRAGLLSELEAQELIDQLVIKLRMIRFLRTPEYNELFSGDPTWVTESIGGMGSDGRTLVTKSSYRILHTLVNLGAAPEPNLTVLWSEALPEPFKKFCAHLSIETSSIQYENDNLMRDPFGDDYGIACCVSAMTLGKQMQFFGARANLAKALLYAINGGRDEISGVQISPPFAPITDERLDYDLVMARFDNMMEWLAGLYVETLNAIHWSHDRYSYERVQMALHDAKVIRTMACGIAGLSVVADSLSAIKYAKVFVERNAEGLAVDYRVEGEYPLYGNDDDRVDSIAVMLVRKFMEKLRAQRTYRNAIPTLSVLTITSNVVYGEKTGSTPDGRRHGEPFAPGANPMHQRDQNGAAASMASVAKLPYDSARDGISYTFSIVPGALGRTSIDRVENLVGLLDGYFEQEGHHINVNVFERETLLDAMEHPEKYPQLTVRVSGYAVHFVKLTRAQQLDVISRTFHKS